MSPSLQDGVWSVATASLYWMSTSRRNTPVPEQRVVANHLGCDLQCGRVHHLRHLWAGTLRGGHCRKINCLRLGDGGQNGPIGCYQALLRPVLGGGGGRNWLCCRRLLCGCWWPSAQGVSHHVLLAWCVSDVRCKLGNEGQLSLLAGRPGCRGAEQGCDQWLVVSDFDFESSTCGNWVDQQPVGGQEI